MNYQKIIRCSSGDNEHTNFSFSKKRCCHAGCESPLQKFCLQCEKYVSYSNSFKHKKYCVKEEVHDQESEAKEEKVYIKSKYFCNTIILEVESCLFSF